MAARKVRRVFATPFVITVAASGCSKGEAPLRPYQVSHEGAICVVEHTCPPGVECKVPEPFAFTCGYRMQKKETHEHPTRASTFQFAEVGGHCFKRPGSCMTRGCLGEEVTCPARPATPLTTHTWSVTNKGGTCTATPERVSSISPQLPAVEIACTEEYEDGATYTVEIDPGRDGNRGCQARQNIECEPNATCNPPAPMRVVCPQ